MSITQEEWIRLIEEEYLSDFITSGGSSLKITIVPREDSNGFVKKVRSIAVENDYLIAVVDSAQTKVHMIQMVFHQIAQQLNWDDLVKKYLLRLLPDNGIIIPEELAPLRDMRAIAEANGRGYGDLVHSIERLITSDLLRNYKLCREFRTAIAMLSRRFINPNDVAETDAEEIRRWLRGEKASLAKLKIFQIYQRIIRQNARLLLTSLVRWLPNTGFRGLGLLIDLDAVVIKYEKDVNPVRYTRGTILDTYEVLRQFIDETDKTDNMLTIVIAGRELVEDPKRGIEVYDALRLRIENEVRDRDRDNPLNSLIWLSAEPELDGAENG